MVTKTMKTFISFDTIDSQLAYRLREILKMKNIDGYLFDLDKKYDSTLHKKITSAINDSEALVAIISKNTCSPSLHEEIGYAIASKKSVIIMLEQNANDGVLSHEREKEIFTKEDFDNSCIRVRDYIEKELSEDRLKITLQTSEKMLKERNLFDEKSDNFGLNENSSRLENPLEYLDASKRPFVLFSACPLNLLENVKITSPKFIKWLEKYRTIKLDTFEITFLKGFEKINLGSLTYYYDHPKKFTRYLEFNENGFIEQGFSRPLIYPSGRTVSNSPLLHLCWLTGAFWSFVIFCKHYYDYIGYDKEIEIILSIHDVKDLMLMGFNGKIANGNRWADPTDDFAWDGEKPHTEKSNIFLKKQITSKDSLTPDVIKKITREFSDKISNAYGLEYAYCYNFDGSLNYELLSWFNQK